MRDAKIVKQTTFFREKVHHFCCKRRFDYEIANFAWWFRQIFITTYLKNIVERGGEYKSALILTFIHHIFTHYQIVT